jgi:hypothetical protein
MGVLQDLSRFRLRAVNFALLASIPLAAWIVGLRAYRTSCIVADSYMADASDGPWVRSKVRLVIDFDDSGASRIAAVPHWIFRFHNPVNGDESQRIYVTFSGDRAFSYTRVLDPVPVIGTRP